MISSRPYLIRAMYDWIVDNQFTPHILIDANAADVQIPRKYVVDGKLVLNISNSATRKLLINNEAVEFDARFGANIYHIYAPIAAVLAIYAHENGRGMVFEGDEEEGGEGNSTAVSSPQQPKPPSKPKRPNLRIVK